ncbi:uncharacterized protein FTOL_13871 [Fusarium torulosum]|uniref:Uncharacterized protein n=1 Tax=Fusarium torulosum TaxID=33205 RepID=A0AAE8MN97_9HYPO|nr:uncharacterized protein FTOL_13871 [Fusarium torulosum]
MANIKARKL